MRIHANRSCVAAGCPLSHRMRFSKDNKQAPGDGARAEHEGADNVPSDESVLLFWQPLTIDAITVHMETENRALVHIPVMQQFGGRDADTHWLLIWQEAFLCLREDSAGALQKRIVRHKKTEHEYGHDRFLVTECCWNRVGFELTLAQTSANDEHPEPAILLHMYPAMGLVLQHKFQRTLLARCYDLRVAAAIVKVCVRLLRVQYRESNVRALRNTLPWAQLLGRWREVAASQELLDAGQNDTSKRRCAGS